MDKFIPFQIPCYLNGFRSISTGGLKFEFITMENVSPEDLTKIMQFKDKLGYLSYNVNIIEAEDILKLKDLKVDKTKYVNAKTDSQRLRAVLYLLYTHDGGNPDDKEAIELHYHEHMEKLINFIKDKLN